MPNSLPVSIDGVAYVEVLRGANASPDASPDLLVEVPHGADTRAHYDALRERLVGELPEELHAFFHMNTDEGAWACGRATAEAIVAADPTRSALLVRCLIPRTFVDCNRPADYDGGNLSSGGLTAGVPVYVKDDRDRALLLELHTAYVGLAEAAYEAVCGQGGYALVPHTYGPRSLDIAGVDETIVTQLREAYAPERVESWPIRAEIDLLTRDADGVELSPPGVEAALLAAFSEAGFDPRANDTYYLHPAALGHRWAVSYPGRVTCLEVRRDLVVESWEPFEEGRPSAESVARIAKVLAPTLARVAWALRARLPPLGRGELL